MSTHRSRMAKGLVIILPVIALGALLTAVARQAASPGRQHGHPIVSHAVVNPTSFRLGVREEGLPGPWAPVERFTRTVGMKPSLVLYYSNWREPFRYGFAEEAYTHSAAVIAQIQSWDVPLSAIASGQYDNYLHSFASEVREFRHPVIIGFDHEMNGYWYPWGWRHQSPESFVAAWRHIVAVFRHDGADNVIWLWTISSSGAKQDGPLRDYWPGERYVTWVGIDGYYYKARYKFNHVFASAIRTVRRISGKPIILSEAAIGQLAGQARMIPNLFEGIRRYHLIGLVWYDVTQHEGIYHQNWRLESHPSAIAAFRREVRSLAMEPQ